jgi:hypothetical protein
MDKKFLNEIPYLSLQFVESLKKDSNFEFYPFEKNKSYYGRHLSLGFSCYALKIQYMTSEHNKLSEEKLNNWFSYIVSFHSSENVNQLFVDPIYLKYYNKNLSRESLRSQIKQLQNLITKTNFDTKSVRLIKGLNAESKQSISTLFELGLTDLPKVNIFTSFDEQVIDYLEELNWKFPWSAGAQFSSYCVYSKTQNLNFEDKLINFINQKVDKNTGSYFTEYPDDAREVINGAMKVITGLDWLGVEIHYPEKLIDFCIENRPNLEGCDVVDYIYVLFKCSKQINYKKTEINAIFLELLDELLKLFHKKSGGFSYFQNQSQNYYYGVPLGKGGNQADLHGTMLCLWALIMVLENSGLNTEKFNVIKP